MTQPRLFAMQVDGFAPGSKLEIAKGSFRGIGFSGHATVVKFDEHALELVLRVSKLLFHIDVQLNFHVTPEGRPQFFGGRMDGKRTGSEPAHVRHWMTVKSQTPERTVFNLELEDQKSHRTELREVAVERTQLKGAPALRLTYDRFELMLAPARRS